MLSTADIYRWLDGSEFMGERLVVQFARGNQPRPRDGYHDAPRMAPRPRRTVHRMTITGLPFETSWQVSILPFRGSQLPGSIISSNFTSSAPRPPSLACHLSTEAFVVEQLQPLLWPYVFDHILTWTLAFIVDLTSYGWLDSRWCTGSQRLRTSIGT